MPDPYADPFIAFDWLFPALEKDLKESKMWPIRLSQHQHQEKLRLLKYITYVWSFFSITSLALINQGEHQPFR